MEEKKYIKPEEVKQKVQELRTEPCVAEFSSMVRSKIVEEQDEMIMHTIQRIGGGEYEEITFDKNKVIDALSKAAAKKPNNTVRTISGKIVLSCAACGKWLYFPEIEESHKPNYCSRCGQKIDWSEVTDDE